MRPRPALVALLAIACVLLGVVLFTPTVLAGPDVETGPGGSIGTAPAQAEADNHTVSVVYDVTLPEDGEDRIVLTIRASETMGEELIFRLRGSDITVLEADGFSTDDNWFVTSTETDEASVTIEYDPTEHIHTRVRDDFTATPEWALFRVVLTAPDHLRVDERVEPEGYRGRTFVFAGQHELHHRSLAGAPFTLVVPAVTELEDSPAEIVETMVETSDYLRVGAREERVIAFVGPEALRRGGYVAPGGVEYWASADLPLSWNVWSHEYVHLRQDRVQERSARWLTEAEARYLQHLIAYKTSQLEGDSGGFSAFQAQLRAYGDHEQVRLQEPSTWELLSNYEKGARVLAAIDAEIRRMTDGRRDYRHVMFRLNQESHVSADVFQNALEAVTGEPMDHVIDPYVNGTGMPPVPDDPGLYRTGSFQPEISYTLDDSVETDASPEARVSGTPVYRGETITVTYELDNRGIDPSLYPEVEVRPPAGWEDKGIEVSGPEWTVDGRHRASGTNVVPDIPIEISVTLEVPENATHAAVAIEVSDADGHRTTAQTSLRAVDRVTANLSVDEPIHEPGTEVTLDATRSIVPLGAVEYAWDLNGNGTFDATTESPRLSNHFDPGGRQVTVRVTNEIGLWDTDTIWVNTTDTPRIAVEERVVAEANTIVEIPVNATSEHGNTSVTWVLPDGNTTSGELGRFRATPGRYDLGVQVIDEFGATNSTVVELLSVDRPTLQPAIPDVTPEGQPVQLDVAVHNEIGEYITTWRLSDGQALLGAATEAELPPGEHTVTVEVVDEFGFSANHTQTVVVSDVPTAEIEGPQSVQAGENATFTALIDNEVGNATVSWEVGDQQTTGEVLERQFQPGTHELTLTVADEYGLWTIVVHEVVVEEPDEMTGFGLMAAIAGALLGLATRCLISRRKDVH